jgi:hypothetical protein
MFNSSKFNDNFQLKPLSIVVAVAASLASVSTFAADGKVQPSGFGIVSADGESSINFTGMVHYDGRIVRSNLPRVTDKDSASVADGFEFVVFAWA